MPLLTLVNKIIRSKGNIVKIKFKVRDESFEAYVPDDQYWISIKDILLNREYEYLPEFELNNFKEKAIVIDAGAHVGLFSLVASGFADKVIAIEPHPINYRFLEINKIKNNCSNIIPVNKALVGKNISKVRIYDADLTSSSTILNKKVKSGYDVSTITLEEIIEICGQIDLLKVDIEGAEFDIFKNVSNKSLRQIRAIVGEIHLEHGDINSITQTLENVGFEVSYFHPPLVKKSSKIPIELHGCIKLKILRRLVYTFVSLGNMEEKSLAILFAKKEK